MFHAIGQALRNLGRPMISHHELRAALTAYIAQHPAAFTPNFIDSGRVDQYVCKMAQNQEWGDTAILQAAHLALHLDIRVITPWGFWDHGNALAGNTIYLWYDGAHYKYGKPRPLRRQPEIQEAATGSPAIGQASATVDASGAILGSSPRSVGSASDSSLPYHDIRRPLTVAFANITSWEQRRNWVLTHPADIILVAKTKLSSTTARAARAAVRRQGKYAMFATTMSGKIASGGTGIIVANGAPLHQVQARHDGKFLHAITNVGKGIPVHLLVVYCPPHQTALATDIGSSVLEVIRHVGKSHAILAGDFNSELQELDWVGMLMAMGFVATTAGQNTCFVPGQASSIDHVLISPSLVGALHSWAIDFDAAELSPHCPIEMTLQGWDRLEYQTIRRRTPLVGQQFEGSGWCEPQLHALQGIDAQIMATLRPKLASLPNHNRVQEAWNLWAKAAE